MNCLSITDICPKAIAKTELHFFTTGKGKVFTALIRQYTILAVAREIITSIGFAGIRHNLSHILYHCGIVDALLQQFIEAVIWKIL